MKDYLPSLLTRFFTSISNVVAEVNKAFEDDFSEVRDVTSPREDWIREHSYHLWEKAGRPSGRSEEFWDIADKNYDLLLFFESIEEYFEDDIDEDDDAGAWLQVEPETLPTVGQYVQVLNKGMVRIALYTAPRPSCPLGEFKFGYTGKYELYTIDGWRPLPQEIL